MEILLFTFVKCLRLTQNKFYYRSIKTFRILLDVKRLEKRLAFYFTVEIENMAYLQLIRSNFTVSIIYLIISFKATKYLIK